MSEQDNNDSPVDEVNHQQEFGGRFLAAREAAGLSVYEVADELKLTEEVVNALEHSQIDILPASTFTQGYIRSYARLLDLPAEDIIKAYTQLLPEKEKPLSARSVLPSQKTSRDSTVKLVTYGMLVMGLILLIAWWYQTDFDWVENTDSDGVEAEVQVEEENTEEQGQTLHQAINMEMAEAPSVERKQQNKIELKEKKATKQKQEASIDNALTEVIKTEGNVSDKLTDEPVLSGNDIVQLTAIADSWIEIQDATNNRLFFGLIKEGDTQKLKGKAPFRMFLGNAPAVGVQLNNRSVDISTYVRKNNVAHVTISRDGLVVNVRRQKKKIKENNEVQSSTDESASAVN